MNSIFSRIVLLFSIFLTFTSCDKDNNDLGAGIIGQNNFEFNLFDQSSVIAYNHKTNEVQTNNLQVNQLGIYEDPFFGTTTASVATQLLLNTLTTTITTGTVTDVTLEIPYFSTKTTTNDVNTYTLNSIYGDLTNKINLSVYRSNVFLQRFSDSGAENIQYFSNLNFDSFILGNKLNDNPSTAQNTEFFFDNSEISTTTSTTGTNGAVTTTIVKTAPALKLKLNNIIGTEILAAGSKLKNNSDFVEFYKGLYFKVAQSGTSKGCLSLLDFSKGTVTISYGESSNLVLNMTGVKVNLLKNASSPTYLSAISSPNKIFGDDNLFLKGGDGSVSVIELFKEDKHGLNGLGGPNGINDVIDLKNSGWIINEANLTFYIDKNSMGNSPNQLEADRIFLYDMNNKRQIIDYEFDNTVGTTTNPAKNVFGGNVIKDASGTTQKYKIRLTNHIRNIVNKDSTNVKLGLCVTQNIANTFFGKTGNSPFSDNNYTNDPVNVPKEPMKYYNNSFYSPRGSIMNPLGVVLYGSKQNIDVSKRLKLEIYYTKPN